MNLLIVDDELEILDASRWFFEAKGFTVYTAASGEAAELCLKQEHPEVLLIDYKLPGMSGAELLKKARQANPEVRAIMITGLTQQAEELETQCHDLGACAFLRKPLQMDQVFQAVNEAGQSRRPPSR